MDNDEMILQEGSEPCQDTACDAEQACNNMPQNEKTPNISEIIDSLGLPDNIATSAKAILEPLEKGMSPGKNLAKLVASALNHDEDVKNAEAQGYLRGRNEIIDEASKACDEQQPQPVNFPIYRKRSFWD